MYNYIYSGTSGILLTGGSSFVWQLIAYLITLDLFWVTVVSLIVIFACKVILFIIKFKEDDNG